MNLQEQYEMLLKYRKEQPISLVSGKKRLIWEYFRNFVNVSNLEKNINSKFNLYLAPVSKIRGVNMTCWPLKDGSKDIYIDETFAVNNLNITNIQITHEVLHGLSQIKDNNQYFFGHKYEGKDNSVFQGVDEATTQLFAEEIENKRLSPEDDYLYFIKNIMRIMKVIFGVQKLANQYLNNNNEFENEFNKLSNNNFYYFIKLINENYILSKKNNYNKLAEDEIELLKCNQEEIINFVELLIIKYSKINFDINNKINQELGLENIRDLCIITNNKNKK